VPTINKPGVYITETLTPTAPSVQGAGESVAVFIGVADRGPTTGSASNVISVATAVNNWSEFQTQFGYSVVSPFDTAATVASASSQAYNNTVGTSSLPLKYAVKSYFDNGGGQAIIVRDVKKDAIQAVASFKDNQQNITQANTWTFDGTSNTAAKKLVIYSSAAEFSSLEAGRLVSFSGIAGAASYTFLNSKKWIVTDVAADGKSFCILYRGSAVPSATQTGTSVKINGGTASVATLDIVAKDHGIWGNNLWVSVTPGSIENTFDLSVYYTVDQSKSSASLVTDNDRVETFTGLSMNSADPRYAPKYVNGNSAWVTLTDKGSSATGYDDLPLFTTLWAVGTQGANVTTSDGSFNWDASAATTSVAVGTFTATSSGVTSAGSTYVNKVRVGSTATTKSTLAGTAGSEGSTAADLGTVGSFTATDILPRLDNVIQPLLINYPDAVNLTSANNGTAITKILNYAANRADSFVIIDPISADITPSNVIQNTLPLYTSNINYGAAYFPNIKITDPASPIPTTTISIPPGGAVAAEYVSTDTSRGVFKAPAGIYTQIGNAKDVAYAMNASDFDTVNGAKYALNIIRPIPGSGVCIMGARTLSSVYADKYVPTRRSLNYIGANLRSLTQFAVFEPNDQILWNSVNGIVTGFLDSFWRAGGLLGATSDQAYYVKCDATTNTTAAIAAGELRVEVGVALQRPAEFIIIKLGQINGGSTITTSS